MFRRLIPPAVLLLALGLLFSCAPAEEEAEAPAEEAEQQIVIYNSYMSDPEPREFDAEVVQQFNEQNPNAEIIHSTVAHEDFKQAIRAYLTSSTPPDVMTWFAGNRARFFIDRDLVMDISDVWEEQGWNEDYPKGFQAMSTVDGNQYFLPTNYYWWAIYYNEDVFEQYDIEIPETWDELMAVAETLKSNGVTPFTVGTKYRWTAAAWFDYLNMRVNGPQFHIDLMLGKESYTDERVKTVFNDYWAPLIENDFFIEDPASYAWAEAIPFMNNGEAAMYLMGDFIRDSYPEDQLDKLDFFRFPIIDPDVPVGEDAPTDGYFMAANAQHAELGKELLAYFGSEEVQTKMAEDLGRLVTNSNVSDDVYNEDQIKGRRILDRADYVAQFYDRDTTPEMADAGMNGFMEFWSDPTPAKTDEILERLEQTRQRLFEEE